MLEVRELRLVLAIGEHGSLARASRVLGIGQPALTRSLAALEARLRGPLFERSRRGVIATNLGRAVLAEAADILSRLERLDSAIAEVRGGQTQELRIAAGNYVGEAIGYRVAARMLAFYPAARMRMIPTDWVATPRMVHAREVTIGLMDLRGLEPDPGLEVEALRRQPGVFVVHREHPLTRLASPTLPDILAFPLIMIGRVAQQVQGPMTAAREVARTLGPTHPAFPALVLESPTIAVNLLRYSKAVVPVTLGIARMAFASGEVVPLRWREPWLSLHPGVVRLRGRPRGEAELAYLDLLHDTDRAIEQESQAWLGELGLSAECA